MLQKAIPPCRLQNVRTISTELKAKLDDAIQNNDIVVIMKGNKERPMCGFSKAVLAILYAEGIENFHTINALVSEELRQGVKEYSQWPTIPQVYIKGEFIGGCDVLVEMHKNDELKKILVEKKLIAHE